MVACTAEHGSQHLAPEEPGPRNIDQRFSRERPADQAVHHLLAGVSDRQDTDERFLRVPDALEK
jgi:hypothetical protein